MSRGLVTNMDISIPYLTGVFILGFILGFIIGREFGGQ